jgi:acetate kinase
MLPKRKLGPDQTRGKRRIQGVTQGRYCAGPSAMIERTVASGGGEQRARRTDRPPLMSNAGPVSMPVLAVLNAGSSSLKFSLYEGDSAALHLLARGQVEGLGTRPRFSAARADGSVLSAHEWPARARLSHAQALDHVLGALRPTLGRLGLAAVGHRVVHGGLQYGAPVRVTPQVLADLERYVPLAPLHQPHNLALIRLLLEREPALPQVACFDTAFHRGQPELAQAFALPRALSAKGVRRYGFHGLSYDYIASVLPSVDPRAAAGRTVVLHLGNGASMCALAAGRSVASTMGFTAADGLPMGTRCGSLDPGVLLYCMDELKMDARGIERLIYQESGLLGVSGISSDMRTLEASPAPEAREAIELFAYRIGRELGSLAAALGGLDAIVFTAGIGEHSAQVRELVAQHAAWLGLELDAEGNAKHGPLISTLRSRVAAWVLPTDEEQVIARGTLALLEDQEEQDRSGLASRAT